MKAGVFQCDGAGLTPEARLDKLARAIEALEPESIGYEQACGRIPVQGLLLAARQHGLRVEVVDVRNSGDTAGSHDRVVGYGAWVIRESASCRDAA